MVGVVPVPGDRMVRLKDYRVANTVEVLNRATNAIWYEMPEEVRRLHTLRGTKGYGWPMITGGAGGNYSFPTR